MTPTDVIEHASPGPFGPTLDRLRERIVAAGLQVIATVDHAAGAHAAGLVMPPTTLILYGHPKGGTPVMLAEPRLALDLPLRGLLREDAAGRTIMAYRPIAPLLEAYGIAPASIARLQAAEQVLLEAFLHD